jgi:hypothetical protein
MAKAKKNWKPADPPEKSKTWLKKYDTLRELWENGKYDNLNEWGHPLFDKPGFFARNPKPSTIEMATPDQIQFVKDVAFLTFEAPADGQPGWMKKINNLKLTKDEFWENQFAESQKEKYFDLFLVNNWKMQVDVFHTYVCWGFNQPYQNEWSEEIADAHEKELSDNGTPWGRLWYDCSSVSDYTMEEGRENAKEEHKNYLVNVPDKRQATLFEKSGAPAYIPGPAKARAPSKKVQKKAPKLLPKKATVAAAGSIVKWEPSAAQQKEPQRAVNTATAKPSRGGGHKQSTLKPVGPAWSFLGWVLEFTMFDYVTNKAYRWTWREPEALAMLSNDPRSLFITKMQEQTGEKWETPPNVKKVKKLFEQWSKKKAHLKWVATVEDIPDIINDFEPMSVKYWSDKYSDDPMGQVYYHEFEPNSGIEMGLNLSKNFPKPKPLAIKVLGCRITHRGIE